MDSDTIENILFKALGKDVFKGVFAATQLPHIDHNYPYCYVLNFDPPCMPGSHWCAIYIDINGLPRYMDSFGRLPQYVDWVNHLSAISKSGIWVYNKAAVQSLTSTACGYYCIYYLVMRHHIPLNVTDYQIMCDLKEQDCIEFVNNLESYVL
jgi:hypothetical protein